MKGATSYKLKPSPFPIHLQRLHNNSTGFPPPSSVLNIREWWGQREEGGRWEEGSGIVECHGGGGQW